MTKPFLITPDWPLPSWAHAFSTTRQGGISLAPYDSFNPAHHVNDDLSAVIHNRHILRTAFQWPHEPHWLNQTHSTTAIHLPQSQQSLPTADAAFTTEPNQVCVVMTADCLPILLCNTQRPEVAAIHAGWRGLHGGIIENTARQLSTPASQFIAWLGPAISQSAFEVGQDVYEAFTHLSSEFKEDFLQKENRWHCDLYAIARKKLLALGVQQIFGGTECTYCDKERFYSYRRDGQTGRMCSGIWISDEARQNF